MTDYIVTKTITTPSRRIPAGAIVRAADIDGPLSAADWQRLGFLADPTPPVEMPVEVDTE